MSRLTGTHQDAARVLVAGGFPVLRLGIGLTLRDLSGVRVVGEAGCAFSCLALALETQADIVVIDTGLAGPHQGFDLCRRLKQLPKPPKVLFYSADNSPRTVTASLSAGADGFVHLSARPDELIEAIRGVREARHAWLLGADQPPRARRGGPRDERGMTQREEQILTLLLQRYTNEEIAAELCLANQTVKNYVSSILRKLGLPSRKYLFAALPDRT